MSNKSAPVISLKDITAGYDGKAVIKDVTFDIFPHDFIGIIGPNGGGKTTLIKVILELLKPFKGTVESTLSSSEAIGYLPQFSQIDEKFPITVKDVILSGKANRKNLWSHTGKKDVAQARQLLQDMNAPHLLDKPIGELSGGETQRVFLARALISNPQVLILDEPNTYVDNKFEGELYEMLKDYNKTMAILMVSHDVGTISAYVKTIACVNETLHYHPSNVITEKQLEAYNCPIQLVTHGKVPHTVLKTH